MESESHTVIAITIYVGSSLFLLKFFVEEVQEELSQRRRIREAQDEQAKQWAVEWYQKSVEGRATMMCAIAIGWLVVTGVFIDFFNS